VDLFQKAVGPEGWKVEGIEVICNPITYTTPLLFGATGKWRRVCVQDHEGEPLVRDWEDWINIPAAQRYAEVPEGTQITLTIFANPVELSPTVASWAAGEEGWTWIAAPQYLQEEELEAVGHRVQPGYIGKDELTEVKVIGTLPGGSTIEVGEPVALRRRPVLEEVRSYELLMEAIKEGENGLREHENRKERMLAYQKHQEVFPGNQT